MKSKTNQAIIAKTKAMYGKRISEKQFEDMLHCHSVPEIAAYLKNQTHFSHALSNINENNIHRGQLENMLKQHLYEAYAKLYHYFPTSKETLFGYIIFEDEIKEILRMVLMLKANNAKSFILDLPGYLISKATVDLMEIAKVQTYEELIQALNETEYAAILRKFKPTPEHPNINYIACEHAFYEYFFKKTFQMIDQTYTGTARSELKQLFSMRVDYLNLSSIYRGKIYFDANDKAVAKRVFPFHHKLTPAKIQELISIDDKETLHKAVMNFIESTRIYSRIPENTMMESYIEHNTMLLRYHSCKQMIHLSTNVSTVFYTFYILSQIELSNVVNIIEGIRYQVSPDKIKQLIIQ